jgi:hypothetical protein
LKEKSAKVLHYFGLDCGMLEFFKYSILTGRPPKNNFRLSRILGSLFGGKDCSLCPYNPSAEEVGGFYEFLYEVAQNFD